MIAFHHISWLRGCGSHASVGSSSDQLTHDTNVIHSSKQLIIEARVTYTHTHTVRDERVWLAYTCEHSTATRLDTSVAPLHH